jgi:RND superfamily putative drug exporter
MAIATSKDVAPADAARRSPFGRTASLVMRHRRAVLVLWLVAFLAGGFAASHINKRLSYDFSLPGQRPYETSARILQVFGNGGTTPPTIVVVTVPRGQTIRGDAMRLASGFAAAQRADPSVRFVDAANSGGSGFTTTDPRTSYAYLFAPPNNSLGPDRVTDAAVASLTAALRGDRVGVTGISQLASGGSRSGPGVLFETLIGGVGALLVLAFVFASVLAIVPIIIAAVSILSTFLVLLGLSYVTPVSFIVQFLVALVGLGVAIDYSLLLVTRWREERALGLDNEDAIVAAMETAGRAVFVSGLTVAIGLLSLVVLPVPFLRSTGIGGALIPVISVTVVLTLLPVLLASVGPRWDWPHVRNEAKPSRGWHRWASLVAARPYVALGAAAVILGLAIAPVFGLLVGQTSAAAESHTGAPHALYVELQRDGVSPGVITPLETLTSAGAGGTVVAALRGAQGISVATLPTGSVGTRGGYSDVLAIPAIETVNSSTLGPVRSAEDAVFPIGGVVGVAGVGPGQQAFTAAVYGNTPLMIAVLALIMMILLARAFRSLVLAIKAVLVNLVTLAATFGILTWFWQDGHGSSAIFGIPATGAVTFWVPITVFAFLFGLSMDYEVFLLSRIRESYDAGASTRGAVIEGLGRTGRLITCAALILFLAFASLASAPVTDIKVLATGLGIGILLDATVVRALLVPSVIVLLGRWNWWLPDWLARVLRVEPRHLRPERTATTT